MKLAKLNVLILCHDVLGKQMAGPGIRYQNVAKILSKHFQVKLGVFSAHNSARNIVSINPNTQQYRRYFNKADVIFAQWLSDSMLEYAAKNGKIVIFDLYAPVPVEYLANLAFAPKPATAYQINNFDAVIEMYKRYLRFGYLFTLSNNRQKDFWLGFLTASNLLDVPTFNQKSLKDNFILAPMGIEATKPRPSKLELRDRLHLTNNDFVLLWTGGIWDWFNAKVVIRAMAAINDRHVKLVFLGTQHPNPIYKEEMGESLAARKLAKELGLIDQTVFFLDGWVPYEKRGSYFLDADAAIYADKESPETRLAHRSRVLDHFWAELPTICSTGDYLSEIIAEKQLGLVVKARSSRDFAGAIMELRQNQQLYKQIKTNLNKHRLEFTWQKTLQPLVSYLKNLDLEKVSAQIVTNYKDSPKITLSFMQRIKRAAKILLLGR